MSNSYPVFVQSCKVCPFCRKGKCTAPYGKPLLADVATSMKDGTAPPKGCVLRDLPLHVHLDVHEPCDSRRAGKPVQVCITCHELWPCDHAKEKEATDGRLP